jgi:hypothetical protein
MSYYLNNPNFCNLNLYAVILYWTIQTITIVRYGDVASTNTYEYIFASVIMIIGELAFLCEWFFSLYHFIARFYKC